MAPDQRLESEATESVPVSFLPQKITESLSVSLNSPQQITESVPVSFLPQKITESVPASLNSPQQITESVPVSLNSPQQITESVPVSYLPQKITESVPVSLNSPQQIAESVPVRFLPQKTTGIMSVTLDLPQQITENVPVLPQKITESVSVSFNSSQQIRESVSVTLDLPQPITESVSVMNSPQTITESVPATLDSPQPITESVSPMNSPQQITESVSATLDFPEPITESASVTNSSQQITESVSVMDLPQKITESISVSKNLPEQITQSVSVLPQKTTESASVTKNLPEQITQSVSVLPITESVCDSKNLPEQIANADQQNAETENSTPPQPPAGAEAKGKVCILTVDGGGMRGIIPGRVLAYLEECLQRKTHNPDARIVDFFDIASGTSVGGLITTMLFTANATGRPLFTGEDTWRLIAEKGKKIFKIPPRHRPLAKLRGILTPRYSTKYMEKILQEHLVREGTPLTLCDTLKPILIPCYDLCRAGPFLFSRSDALEAENRNFRLWEICRATSAVPSFFKPVLMSSMDGSDTCTAVDGGLVLNNPTAATIAHVLHNKAEFPGAGGVGDLLVLSLGTGQFDRTYEYKKVRYWGAFQWAKPVVKIVLDGISDMVDHTISMSFGEARQNYVRVQVSGLPDRALMEMDDPSNGNVKRLMKMADNLMEQNSMEHLPFGGRRPLAQKTTERLEWFADQLIQEQKARASRLNPTVILKQPRVAKAAPLLNP